jgi:hypothetical protein
MWDPRKDAWFAGFTDGEGSFNINLRNVARDARTPRFQINLRIDDAPVLEALRVAFGGTICYEAARKNGAPNCCWSVVAKRDLARLIEYFDRFPLRAKKSRDYAIWRQAARVYLEHSASDPRLGVLRDALIAGRCFSPGEDPASVEVLDAQFALEVDGR